jgi:hypothetical protein
MSRSWILTAPVALVLLVAGCATNAPSNQIAPTPGVGAGVGNTPGMPVSPNTPPAISGSLTNTEALSTPAPGTTRQRVRRSPVDNRGGFGGAGGRAPTNSSGQMQSPGS